MKSSRCWLCLMSLIMMVVFCFIYMNTDSNQFIVPILAIAGELVAVITFGLNMNKDIMSRAIKYLLVMVNVITVICIVVSLIFNANFGVKVNRCYKLMQPRIEAFESMTGTKVISQYGKFMTAADKMMIIQSVMMVDLSTYASEVFTFQNAVNNNSLTDDIKMGYDDALNISVVYSQIEIEEDKLNFGKQFVNFRDYIDGVAEVSKIKDEKEREAKKAEIVETYSMNNKEIGGNIEVLKYVTLASSIYRHGLIIILGQVVYLVVITVRKKKLKNKDKKDDTYNS